MELILLFLILLGFSLLIFGFSKYVEERRLKLYLLMSACFLLLSLWVGLFLETPERENGNWIALVVTACFLLGLSIFFVLFFQVFCERFYNLPILHFSYSTLHAVFLNLFGLLNAVLLKIIHFNLETKALITSILAHGILIFLYVPFYHKIYNKFETVRLEVQFKLYLFFAVVSILYFSVGFMALFVLSPFGIPEPK